ncbi:MAG: RNA methyltransferase [Kiritimatiellia bacterium]|jgi:TrmH family RNA methyltransferase
MSLDNIRIVLVGTLYGGNVGSACRAMSNMGIRHLRLVAPDAAIDWAEAEKMAVHADDVLAARETFATLDEAVADCIAAVGTTARRGLYRQHALSPRETAAAVAPLAATGPVAIVFGREDSGLDNAEVACCTHLVQIPTAEYSSLNLAQAVMVMVYELFLVAGQYEPVQEKSPPASVALRSRLVSTWREYLGEIGFMEPDMADHMMAAFSRIFSRGALTEDDVRILLGVVRQSRWAVNHSPRDGE